MIATVSVCAVNSIASSWAETLPTLRLKVRTSQLLLLGWRGRTRLGAAPHPAPFLSPSPHWTNGFDLSRGSRSPRGSRFGTAHRTASRDLQRRRPAVARLCLSVGYRINGRVDR